MMVEFSVTDPQTPKRCIEAINGSFDSIKEMIADYKPKETMQDYAVIFYKGDIKEGQSLYVDRECENAIPVYCQYGGTHRYVGTLDGREVTFITDLEDVVIYQPYRLAIVKQRNGITKDSFYYNNVNNEEVSDDNND